MPEAWRGVQNLRKDRLFGVFRTCRAAEVLNAMGRPFYVDKNELFPIPQAEIDRNPALQGDQNPGF